MRSTSKNFACISVLLLASTSVLACSSVDDDEETAADTRIASVTQAVSEGDTRTETRWVGSGYYKFTYTFIDGKWVLTSRVYCDTATGFCGPNQVPPPVLQ